MNEKPILFNPEMVGAILDGRKTQTRRVIKKFRCPNCNKEARSDYNSFSCDSCQMLYPITADWVKSPCGIVGERLWVRERFCIGSVVAGDSSEGEPASWYIEQCEGEEDCIPYEQAIREGIGIEEVKWKPSIFMFRKDSRINLEVTGIRIERLKEISGEDARAEGIGTLSSVCLDGPYWDDPVESFKKLWKSINGQSSWDENPFVWVIEFKLINGEKS